jgi:hypothetical protein
MKQKLNTTLFLCALIIIGMFFQPDVINGQVKAEKITSGERFLIHSKILNEERTIKIWFPTDYEKSKKKYPVLYLLDAEYFFQQAASAVQFLSECDYISNHPIPQMIIEILIETGIILQLMHLNSRETCGFPPVGKPMNLPGFCPRN